MIPYRTYGNYLIGATILIAVGLSRAMLGNVSPAQGVGIKASIVPGISPRPYQSQKVYTQSFQGSP